MDTHFESDSDPDPDAEVRNTIRISVLKYQRPLTNPLVTRRFTRHSVRLPAAPRTTATLPLAGCPYLMRSPSLPLSLAGVRSTGRLRGQVDEEDSTGTWRSIGSELVRLRGGERGGAIRSANKLTTHSKALFLFFFPPSASLSLFSLCPT